MKTEQTVTVPATLLRELATGADELADELHERARDNIHPDDLQVLVDEADGWRAAARRAYEIVGDR